MLYLFEDFVLDSDRRELRRGDELLSVEPQVFDLLQYLIRNRDRVVSKDDLVSAVWQGRIVSDATLSSRINAARNALRDSGEEQRLIRTILRKGIRFVGAVREEDGAEAMVAVEQPKPALGLPDRPSIAVLPFVNMSGDPEQDYFADGMVEDIITGLSRIKWLFVIARNSSFAYKGRAVDVKQVGRDLGVRYVLEGSVRKAANRVRISGSAHRGGGRPPSLGRTLRPRPHRRVRAAGRDHHQRRRRHRAQPAPGRDRTRQAQAPRQFRRL